PNTPYTTHRLGNMHISREAAMRWSTPTVRQRLLLVPETQQESQITVGTSAWYAWLETATLFSFVTDDGTFTERKDRRQRGGWYWKAYRAHHGKLARAYLGETERLSLERLEQVAQTLLVRGQLAEQSPAGRNEPSPDGLVGTERPRAAEALLPGG